MKNLKSWDWLFTRVAMIWAIDYKPKILVLHYRHWAKRCSIAWSAMQLTASKLAYTMKLQARLFSRANDGCLVVFNFFKKDLI